MRFLSLYEKAREESIDVIATGTPSGVGYARTPPVCLPALARSVNTPEIVVSQVNAEMADGRFDDRATIAFARGGFATMFAG